MYTFYSFFFLGGGRGVGGMTIVGEKNNRGFIHMWHQPLYFTFSVHSYVHGAPYLRNHISCDHNFRYTFVKWWYFLLFHLFNLGFLSIKEQKIVQNEWKIKVCHVQYLRNSMAYDHDFWCKYVKWKYLQIFIFIFSKFWFFGLLWVTGQKMAQNDKKFCHASCLRKHIWLSFMVRIWRMIISSGIFFMFSKFLFSRCLDG